MKTIKSLFGVLVALIMFVSCDSLGGLLGGVGEVQLDKKDLSFSAEGGSETIKLTAPVDWKITVKEAWLNVNPYEGTGADDPQEITVTVRENPTAKERIAKLAVLVGTLKDTIVVTQAAGDTGSGNEPGDGESGKITLDKKSINFVAEGGEDFFNMTSPVDWKISVVDNAAWLSVNPTEGKGSDKAEMTKVTVTVSKNETVDERVARLAVAAGELKDTVVVIQAAKKVDDPVKQKLELDRKSLSMTAEGGEEIFKLTSSLDWEISCKAEWLAVNPVKGAGSDNAQDITVTVLQNETAAERVAKVAVAAGELKDTVVVIQAAGELVVDPPAGKISLAEAIALADETEASVEGLVVARYANGVLISDGEVNMLVFEYTPNYTVKCRVGDKLAITATKTTYGGHAQLSDVASLEIIGSGPIPDSDPITYDSDNFYELSDVEAPIYIEYTGTLDISGKYYNVNIEGASITGSISYPEGTLKEELASLDGSLVKVTGYFVGITGSSTKYANTMAVKVEKVETPDNPDVPEQPKVSLSEAIALDDNTKVSVEGWVIARYANGVLISDHEVNMLVFEYTPNYTVKSQVGEKLAITATKTTYGGHAQLTDVTSLEVIDRDTVPDFEPTIYDADNIYELSYVESPIYIQYTGTLNISGKYYNVNIEGTSMAGSISYPEGTLKEELASLDGSLVTVTGYFVGITGSSTKYANTMAVSVRKADDPDVDIPDNPENPDKNGLVTEEFNKGDIVEW